MFPISAKRLMLLMPLFLGSLLLLVGGKGVDGGTIAPCGSTSCSCETDTGTKVLLNCDNVPTSATSL
jgi:hypothetical protein